MMRFVDLRVQVTPEANGIMPPYYPTEYAGGLVVRAARAVRLLCGEPQRVPIGFAICLPDELGAMVSCYAPAMRSCLFASPQMFGADDRDPLEIVMTYSSDDPANAYSISRGDPIAELSFVPLLRAKLVPIEKIPDAPGKPRRSVLSDHTEFGVDHA